MACNKKKGAIFNNHQTGTLAMNTSPVCLIIAI